MTNILSTAAEEIVDQVKNQPEIKYLTNSDDIPSIYIDTIKNEAIEVKTLSNEMHASKEEVNKSFLKLMSSLQAMQSAAELLDQILAIVAANVQSSSRESIKMENQQSQIQLKTSKISIARLWISGTLIPWINSLFKSAWSLISKLSTPTEWRLKGELGINVLGLAKSSIEIKFG